MNIIIQKTTIGHFLEVNLVPGDVFFAEPGAIISADAEIDINSELAGGVMTSAMRMLGGGESAFINKISAKQDVKIQLGTVLPSEIKEIELDGGMILGDGVYIAHTGNIKISSKFGGLSSMVAGSGLMFLHVEGKGNVYLAGCESMFVKELGEGETFYLDNTCFVGCNDGMNFQKFMAGKGLTSKLMGGEGIMIKFTGPGKVFYQTESPSGLAYLLKRFIKTRK